MILLIILVTLIIISFGAAMTYLSAAIYRGYWKPLSFGLMAAVLCAATIVYTVETLCGR